MTQFVKDETVLITGQLGHFDEYGRLQLRYLTKQEAVILEVNPIIPTMARQALRSNNPFARIYTVQFDCKREAWVNECIMDKLPPGGIGTKGDMREIYKVTGWVPGKDW